MSNLEVLDYWISKSGDVVKIEFDQPNEEQLEITRIEQSHNKYAYIVDDHYDSEIDITYLISKEIKQKFATIYHEQYELKNL